MLHEISIKNFGLFDDISISFSEGLNVLTGETGAGKSIIIEALRFLLGAKLNKSSVKDPGRDLEVEGVFYLSDKNASLEIFSDFLDERDTFLSVRRAYTSDGKNKVKINNISAPLSVLKNIGKYLIDFHGAYDHQLILDSGTHITVLDRLAKNESFLSEYGKLYEKYSSFSKELQILEEKAKRRDRELIILRDEIAELESVPLDEESYRKAFDIFSRISNMEKIISNIDVIRNIFENDDYGISSLLSNAFKAASSIAESGSFEEITSVVAEIERMQDNANSVIEKLASYADSVDMDGIDLFDAEQRCDIYNKLIRKYGPSMEDVKKYYAKLKREYELLSDIELNMSDIKKNICRVESEVKAVAEKLRNKRLVGGKYLVKAMEKELSELGIKYAKFDVKIEKTDYGKNGCDAVSFYISPNPGEPLKPLAEIVSSGEAARLMLALKRVLSDTDPVDTLIFDEIDAQIGGRLGDIIGRKLKSVSQLRQVILITHLPQIAAFADKHLKVSKNVSKSKTEVNVEDISLEPDRISELAQMFGGSESEEVVAVHAKELLKRAGLFS